jgi:hypothetical protein
MKPPHTSFNAILERKHPKLPVYIVVPPAHAHALGLAATAVVEGTVNGHATGRRSIKRWDQSPESAWFVEFTAPFCGAAGVAVGDRLAVSLWLANPALPLELENALAQSATLRQAWDGLSDYARRSSAEHIHAAKSAQARSRRAAATVAKLAQLAAAPPPQKA